MMYSERELESQIESDIVDLVREHGGVALKLVHDGDQSRLGFSRRGTPDRTLLLPGGRIIFVEVKRPGGSLSVHQEKWIRALRRLGFRCRVIYNLEELRGLLEKEYDNQVLTEIINDPS